MDRRIDLDAAAAILVERLDERRDLEPDPIAWKGFEARFDEPFKTDRRDVADPYSVGVAIRRGDEEGRLVLYAGGWADFEYWSGDVNDDLIDRVPGWEDWLDLTRFSDVVVDFLSMFRIPEEAFAFEIRLAEDRLPDIPGDALLAGVQIGVGNLAVGDRLLVPRLDGT